jgi:hypothetical protein
MIQKYIATITSLTYVADIDGNATKLDWQNMRSAREQDARVEHSGVAHADE